MIAGAPKEQINATTFSNGQTVEYKVGTRSLNSPVTWTGTLETNVANLLNAINDKTSASDIEATIWHNNNVTGSYYLALKYTQPGNWQGQNLDVYVNTVLSTNQDHLPKRQLGYGTCAGSDIVGTKRFEISNHLGNVLAVITDRKWAKDAGTFNSTTGALISATPDGNVDYYEVTVVAYNDYYPYGMLMDQRHGTAESYRYGFQGQEKDDEVKGEGNSINYKYRMHDPRIGRFFAIDPLAPKYPWYTPYQFSGNEVISKIELEGLEPTEYCECEGNVGTEMPAENRQTGEWSLWTVEKVDAETFSFKEIAILDSKTGDVISKNPEGYYFSNRIDQSLLKQTNSIQNNSDRFNTDNALLNDQQIQITEYNKMNPIPEEQDMSDVFWEETSFWTWLRYKANTLDQRYEGPQGLENFARDGLVVVSTAGQIAMFIPGGQGVGTLMMGFADLGETAFDINDQGWVNGLSNGAIRWSTGKFGALMGRKFAPSDFAGSKVYKVGYEGGIEVITEMTENEAIDYFNTLH